jgi:hypothetical protein
MDASGSFVIFAIGVLLVYMFAMAVVFEMGVAVLCRSIKLHGLLTRMVQFCIAAYVALSVSFLAWAVSSADWGWRLSTVASHAIATVVYWAVASGCGFVPIYRRSALVPTTKQVVARSMALGLWCTGIAFALLLVMKRL